MQQQKKDGYCGLLKQDSDPDICCFGNIVSTFLLFNSNVLFLRSLSFQSRQNVIPPSIYFGGDFIS